MFRLLIYFRPTTWLYSCASQFGKLFCWADLWTEKDYKMEAVIASIALHSDKQVLFAALDGRWFGIDDSYPSHMKAWIYDRELYYKSMMKVTPIDGILYLRMKITVLEQRWLIVPPMEFQSLLIYPIILGKNRPIFKSSIWFLD